MLAMLIGGFYWFKAVEAVCQAPLSYSIGTIDGRFGITQDEARSFVDDAASIWEDASEKNLFSYDPESNFKINFIFDERQQTAIEAEERKEELDQKEGINETLSITYAALVAKYQDEKLKFEGQKETYEKRLSNYNEEVDGYNRSGGAPPDVYAELEERKVALDQERQAINDTAEKLNDLASQINKIGEQGNHLIDDYNEEVKDFNDEFSESREFTQGDYQGDRINIYTFRDFNELKLVLAHELGHALSLGHVDDHQSIMYYLMGEQPMDSINLTDQDIAEFQAICGEKSVYQSLRQTLINWLQQQGVI